MNHPVNDCCCKGFYSAANITSMYNYGYHFIVSMTMGNKTARDAVDGVMNILRHPRNLNSTAGGDDLYACSVDTHWNAEGMDRPCRIHVYTRPTEEMSARNINFDRKLRKCLEELNGGSFIAEHAALYGKYFKEIPNTDGTVSYGYDDEKISLSENRYSGYICIITDDMAKDATEILDIYRDKDGVEKIFDDIKNAQDCKRLGLQSRETMEGKMFVVFLASILMSEVRQRMKACDGKEWMMELLRRSLDKITTSRIAYSNSRKPRELNSIVSLTQRKCLSSLLKVEEKEVEGVLFKILV
jgi:hypothetical protein